MSTARDGRLGGPFRPQLGECAGRARPLGAQRLPTRKKLPHDIPLWLHREDSVWFITICTSPRGKNQLCHDSIAGQLFESIQFRIIRGDCFVTLALLMPDHIHLLASFPPEAVIRKVISQWKEIVAKKFRIHWQRDFFDHRLRHDEGLRDREDYIRFNPVRAGLVSAIEHWPYVWTPSDGAPSGRALPFGMQANAKEEQ